MKKTLISLGLTGVIALGVCNNTYSQSHVADSRGKVLSIERGVYSKGKRVYFVPLREGVSGADIIIELGEVLAHIPELDENNNPTGRDDSVETLRAVDNLYDKIGLSNAGEVAGFFIDVVSDTAVITVVSYSK